MADRSLPHSQEAEEATVGGILFSGRSLAEVQDLLQAEDFHHPALEAIYAACLDVDAQGRPIDIITVAEQMRAAGTLAKLKAHNGEAYLVELASKIATIENITHHARIVRDLGRIRAITLVASEVVKQGYACPADALEFADSAQRRLADAATGLGEETIHELKPVLHAAIKTLEDRYKYKRAMTGAPTGILAFDEMTGGLHAGDLVVLAARPSMGKTSLGFQWLLNAASPPMRPADSAYQDVPLCPGLVFSLEMSKESLAERALSSEGRIDSQRLRGGFLETRDWITITKAAGMLSRAPVWIDDRSLTLAQIRAKARRWRQRADKLIKESGGTPVILIDYLQLVQNPSGKGGNREQEISSISRGLKALAKDLGAAIIALSQLNRGLESRKDKRPMSADLRESGAVEQDADLICFIYRDEVYNPETEDKGIAEIILGKQRNGPTGTVRTAFLPQYTRFENLIGAAARPAPRPVSTGKQSWHDRGDRS